MAIPARFRQTLPARWMSVWLALALALTAPAFAVEAGAAPMTAADEAASCMDMMASEPHACCEEMERDGAACSDPARCLAQSARTLPPALAEAEPASRVFGLKQIRPPAAAPPAGRSPSPLRKPPRPA